MGSGVGGVCRYILSNSLSSFYPSFPLGTLVVNMLGMFLIGLFSVWLIEKNVIQSSLREFILIGFLGGLTTFSTFGNESFQLYTENRYYGLFFYLSGNLLIGFSLLIIGKSLGKG